MPSGSFRAIYNIADDILQDKNIDVNQFARLPGRLDLPRGMANRLGNMGVIKRAPYTHALWSNYRKVKTVNKYVWLAGLNYGLFMKRLQQAKN